MVGRFFAGSYGELDLDCLCEFVEVAVLAPHPLGIRDVETPLNGCLLLGEQRKYRDVPYVRALTQLM